MTAVRPAATPVLAFGTTFQNPILVAAGTAGFGREISGVVDIDALGGVITKAVSPEPRRGHPAPRVAEFAGGMLNAVGLANPGLEHVAQTDIPWLERHVSRARVLVNVVGAVIEDFATVVERLDACTIVTAFELNLSCPNTTEGGEEFSADARVLAELVSRCRRATTKPLVAKLGPSLPDMVLTAAVAEENGVDGFSLVNTLPGSLYQAAREVRSGESTLGFGRGGVSGPALLPIGVLAVTRVRERTRLPIIGMGGIRTLEDVDQYMAAGATLVAVGTAGFADPRAPERLARQWEQRG